MATASRSQIEPPAAPARPPIRQNNLLLSLALLAIASIGLFCVFHNCGPILTSDAKDYAQIAREIARGHGMQSKLLLLELLPDSGPNPGNWPNLFRPPFPVYVMAAVFRILGASNSTIPIWSSLCFVATTLVMFWGFAPVFGRGIAFVAAAAFAVSPAGLLYAASGLTESCAMLLLSIACIALLRFPSTWGAAVIGLSMGICALTRPVAYLWGFVLAALLIWWARSEQQQWIRSTAVIALAFALPVAAAGAGLHWHGGRALLAANLAYHTSFTPADALRSPLVFVLHHPFALARKATVEMLRPVVYGFRIGEVLLFSALSFFGLAMRTDDSTQRKARWIVLALLVSTAIALSPLTEGDAFASPLRYFDVFAPLLLPWGVAALWVLRDHIPANAFIGLLVVMFAGNAAQIARDPVLKLNPAQLEMYGQVGAAVSAADLIATSSYSEATAIAWFADRYVVQCDPDGELRDIRNRGVPVRWYFGADSEEVPDSFQAVKRWPRGFTLWRLSP